MDQHKQGMIRQWVENQSNQVRSNSFGRNNHFEIKEKKKKEKS